MRRDSLEQLVGRRDFQEAAGAGLRAPRSDATPDSTPGSIDGRLTRYLLQSRRVGIPRDYGEALRYYEIARANGVEVPVQKGR